MITKVEQIILRRPHAYVIVFVIFVGVWLFSFWPGYFDIDTAYLFEGLQRGNLSVWHSYSYSLIFNAIWETFHSLGPLLLLQFGFFIFAGIWILRELERQNRNLAFGFLFLCFFLPLHPFQLLAFLRDSFFSSLLPLLLILLFDVYRNPAGRLLSLRLSGIAILTVILCSLRLDAIIFLPIVAGICWWKLQLTRRNKVRFVFGLVGLFFLTHLGLSSLQKSGLYEDRKYQLTSFVHPLSAIVHHGEITVAEADTIDKVISVTALKERFDLYQIRPFHEVGPRRFSEEEWMQLRELLPQIFWRNFGVFLENRWILFLANLGIDGPLYIVIGGGVDPSNPVTKNYDVLGLTQPRDSNWIGQVYRGFARMALGDTLVRLVGFSALPFLFLCYLLVRNRKKNPLALWLLAMSWSRLPLIFLFSPGSHLKYCYQIYLATIFCYYLGRLERLSQKPEKEVVA